MAAVDLFFKQVHQVISRLKHERFNSPQSETNRSTSFRTWEEGYVINCLHANTRLPLSLR